MREKFETDADRKNQAELAEGVKRLMGWGLRDLGKSNAHYNLDFFATDNGTRHGAAWVEVKTRSHTFGTYPTIMLSAGKWRDGVSLSQTSQLPFLLFFGFADGVYRYRYDPKHVVSPTAMKLGLAPPNVVTFEWGGRTVKDRDEADAEPVALIPLALWERVVIPPAPEREKAPFESDDKPAPGVVEHPF